MAAVIEVKYFNSYILKKIKSVQPIKSSSTVGGDGNDFTFVLNDNYFTYSPVGGVSPDSIGSGQKLTYTKDGTTYTYVIVGWESIGGGDFKIYLNKAIASTNFTQATFPYVTLYFGNIVDFNYVPGSSRYVASATEDWYIEESRIRGGYNNTSTDYGVRAYIVEDNPSRQTRSSSLIHSGIFNSRTGINNTNQFSGAEDITRTLDPSQASIQKLYAEDTNLIIFQELKVSRALIDKDAIYTAEGQPLTTSSLAVIGEIQAYAGNYGISTNPESFAVYGYRKYFVDRNKNSVLRLSQDGITEISDYGMVDFFRDNLGLSQNGGKVLGMWDMHNKLYVVSIQTADNAVDNTFVTVGFDEDVLGWVSRYSFRPRNGFSLRGEYYTAAKGNIWKHYSANVNYCNFYDVQYYSTVTSVFNIESSSPKTFQTTNYEGSNGWAVTNIQTDASVGVPVASATISTSLTGLENQLFTNNFKIKENKFYATIINVTPASDSVAMYGQSASGLLGFYMTNTYTFPDPSTVGVTFNKPAILFAVSSTFVSLGN